MDVWMIEIFLRDDVIKFVLLYQLEVDLQAV